jgi:hypothetical protein
MVACDVRTYHRIKIKSPKYLIIHYRTVGIENENKQGQFCLMIWLQGEKQEYLNYFPQYIQDYDRIEKQLEELIIPSLINEFTTLYSSDNKEFFDHLNTKYPSSGKPNQDRKRLIFTKIFQQYQSDSWNHLDNEQKCVAVRNILRQRNTDNTRKFIFEKYLHSLTSQ